MDLAKKTSTALATEESTT